MTAEGAPKVARRRVTPATPEPRSDAGPRLPTRALPVLLAAALALCALGFGLSLRRATRLETQVLELTGALQAAEADVNAHRSHLASVREGLVDLRQRFDALEALVAREPRPASPAPTD